MYRFIVDRVDLLTPTTVRLRARRSEDEPRLFSYQPGQYAAIGIRKHRRPSIVRCFSISSSPTEQSHIEFGIRIKGKFTRSLLTLKQGDSIDVHGPYGGFVFDADRDSEAVLLAGGIGISPLISMARFASDTRLTNSMTLLYSCHSSDDVPYASQLDELEKTNPHFRTVYAIGKGLPVEQSSARYQIGRINPVMVSRVIGDDWQNKTFFICGPTAFMNGMVSMLKGHGVLPGRIMTEAFGQGSTKQTGKIRSWPFNIYTLGAASLAAGSFAVMVGDLLKTLPPETLLNASDPSRAKTLTNNRQTDLDALVNSLPEISSTAPATSAASQAEASSTASNAQTNQTQPNTQTTPSSPAPSIAQPAPAPSPAPAPAPAPTPAPTPTCTTTQSGVTTCQ